MICPACDSLYRIEEKLLNCRNCGTPLQLAETAGNQKRKYVGTGAFLKPLADSMDKSLRATGSLQDAGGPTLKQRIVLSVRCGWCGHQFPTRPESPNCEQCGGVLPPPPGFELGSEPPPPVRKLPGAFTSRLFFKQNLGGWLGIVVLIGSILSICVLGPLSLIGILFGWALMYSNFMTAYRRRAALQKGVAVPGKIESVTVIGNPKGKGAERMFRVYYRWEFAGKPYHSMKYTYDEALTNHFVGESVWVVCLPNSAKCNDVWPPLA